MAWVFGLGTIGLTYMGLQEWSSFDFDLTSLLPSKKKDNTSDVSTAAPEGTTKRKQRHNGSKEY